VRVPDLKLCEQRKALLAAAGHLLVLGGPGCGKTTIALIKAAMEIANGVLAPAQKILFLSFARATVARIIQESRIRVPREVSLEYRDQQAAGKLAGIAKGDRPAELQRLLAEHGLLGFDLFAGLGADLLEQSPRLCCMLADCYPVIILDEFQDINLDEWRVIAALGQHSRLITLADVEQRIYEFRGADPARIGQFSNGGDGWSLAILVKSRDMMLKGPTSSISATTCSPARMSVRITDTSRYRSSNGSVRNSSISERRTTAATGTYHGFAWEFIRGHGYLLTGHRRLLLPPPRAISVRSPARNPTRRADRSRGTGARGGPDCGIARGCTAR
jgi:hypothetical protein